jgi:hypothetical protein
MAVKTNGNGSKVNPNATLFLAERDRELRIAERIGSWMREEAGSAAQIAEDAAECVKRDVDRMLENQIDSLKQDMQEMIDAAVEKAVTRALGKLLAAAAKAAV